MNFLKLKNVNTPFHSVFPNAPRLNAYINTDHVYMAYDSYDWGWGIYFVLKGNQRTNILASYADGNINDIETSDKVTNAVSRAINAKPGTGVIDLFSMQEFVDAGEEGISYVELATDLPETP